MRAIWPIGVTTANWLVTHCRVFCSFATRFPVRSKALGYWENVFLSLQLTNTSTNLSNQIKVGHTQYPIRAWKFTSKQGSVTVIVEDKLPTAKRVFSELSTCVLGLQGVIWPREDQSHRTYTYFCFVLERVVTTSMEFGNWKYLLYKGPYIWGGGNWLGNLQFDCLFKTIYERKYRSSHRRQMVHPRHQTPQRASVAQNETLL